MTKVVRHANSWRAPALIAISNLGVGAAGWLGKTYLELKDWPLLALCVLGGLIPYLSAVTSIGIDGTKVDIRLREAEKKAADADKVARLAAQSALILSHIPGGSFISGGNRPTGHGSLRERLSSLVDDLGIDEEVKEQIFSVEDPYTARNLLNGLSYQVHEALKNMGKQGDELMVTNEILLPITRSITETNIPAPDLIFDALHAMGIKDPYELSAVKLYEEWYASRGSRHAWLKRNNRALYSLAPKSSAD